MITDQSITLLLAVLVLVLVFVCGWLARRWGDAVKDRKWIEGKFDHLRREANGLRQHLNDEIRESSTTARHNDDLQTRIAELERELAGYRKPVEQMPPQDFIDDCVLQLRSRGFGLVGDGTVYGNGVWLNSLRVTTLGDRCESPPEQAAAEHDRIGVVGDAPNGWPTQFAQQVAEVMQIEDAERAIDGYARKYGPIKRGGPFDHVLEGRIKRCSQPRIRDDEAND